MIDETAAIRVVVVDSHILFRQGLIEMLSAERDIGVVDQCGVGHEAIAIVKRTQPDIVLLDSDHLSSRSVKTLRGLIVVSPRSKVVVIAAHDEPRVVGEMVSAGAHAFVPKNITCEELLVTLRTVHRDSDHVVISVSRETLQGLSGLDRPLLSKREREVLRLVAEGMRNSEIASELYISEGTVKRHLTNAYSKLDAVSRIGAIKKALSLGLLSLNEVYDADEE